MTAHVRRLGASEWTTLRDARTTALEDAPYAFNSTHADALGLDEAAWRARLAEQAWFVAERDGPVVGMAACGRHRDEPTARVLRSMWVAHGERGRGTAVDLLDEAVAWATADGGTVLVCWALHTAPRARAFYPRHGFVEVEAAVENGDGPLMSRYERTL